MNTEKQTLEIEIESHDTHNNDIKEKIIKANEKLELVINEVKKKIVGQDNLIKALLVSLLARGHILLEWAPGLAKTLSVETLSKTLDLTFKRIQFTPDLLPSDLLGAKIYRQEKNEFYTKKWPIFANFILADEVNRAPSKVQSAMLEAMAERQVTIWEDTMKLDSPFVVLATQNPIEQEGTFNLPEAQLDRFLLKVVIDYPTSEEEKEIMKRYSNPSDVILKKILHKDDILKLQDLAEDIYVDDKIYEYVKDIVLSTRYPDRYWISSIKGYISYWVSPRASIALVKSAKSLALLEGRSFVLPEDIKEIAHLVLRHRLILSYEAMADDITPDYIISEILNNVKIV